MSHTLTLDQIRVPTQIDNAEAILEKFNELDAATQAAPVSYPAAVAWADATPFSTGDVVVEGGVAYSALQDHTSSAANDQPGVGTNEGDFWAPLAATLGGLTVVGGSVPFEMLLPLADGTPGVSTIKNLGPATATVKVQGTDTMRDSDGGDATAGGYGVSGASSRQFGSDGTSVWDVI